MTAINALVRRDRVHLMTDGAVYQPDGAVVGSMQKVYILAHADAVLAYRGPTYIGPTLYGALNAASLTGFDDLLSKLIPAVLHTLESLAAFDPEVVAEANARLDLRRADVVVAGWSRARGQGEVYKLDTNAEVWRLEPQADGFMMPGDNPALIARLEAHGWDLADERQDERRLLELLPGDTATPIILPGGGAVHQAGFVHDGLALAALLSRDALLAEIDRAIEASADDEHAVGTDERKRRIEALEVEILAAEREEEALILQAIDGGLAPLRRADASPEAVLQVRVAG